MRTIEEIYQALCSQFAQITGLTAAEGGDLSVRFYAVAAELFSLYAQAEWTRDQCFPQTAQGELLDLHGQLLGVTRREAGLGARALSVFLWMRSGTARYPLRNERCA